VETFEDPSKTNFAKAFLPLVLFNLLLISLGWMNFRKEKQIV
jgi:ABC-2 type transport system permease protein